MKRTIVNRSHVAEAFHLPNAPALIAQGLHLHRDCYGTPM